MKCAKRKPLKKTKKKMKKTYKDIFADNGIAAIFAANFATDFTAFFVDNTAAAVDAFIMHKYSDKPLTSDITADTAATVVTAVIAIHLASWRKINAALSAQYTAIDSANEIKTKSGTIEREGTDGTTATTANKAFNDTDFVSDTQNVNSGENSATETYDITETRTNTENAAENVAKEVQMRTKYNLQMQVIETIINEITISIY